MMATYRKAVELLTPAEKRRGLGVLALVVVMAALEVLGVASVMPFLRVLADPGAVETSPVLRALGERLGLRSSEAFLIGIGAGASLLILLASAARTVTHYAMSRFVEMRRHAISQRLLEGHLRQPYPYFLTRSGSDMAKGLLSEVDQLIDNVYRPGILATAYAVVAAAMVGLMVLVEPLVALLVAVVLGGLYAAIYGGVRGLLSRSGRERADANEGRFALAAEALRGIKAVKLHHGERAYLAEFEAASARYSRCETRNQVLADAPRFVIEGIALGGVLALAVGLLLAGGSLEAALPVLGLYAFAGYRALPAFQRVYHGLAHMRFGAAAVDDVHADLHRLYRQPPPPEPAGEALALREALRVEAVSYTHPGAEAPTLRAVSLEVPAGRLTALCGETGSGKSTLIDLLLGLLAPDTGTLRCDGRVLSGECLAAWQRGVGYVPQEVFLRDRSLAENIAFCVPPEQIDMRRIRECAELAQIDRFITEALPAGYATRGGEAGSRLSGGQRQRIGIARALYRDPSLLVLDEPTSALDTQTEAALLAALSRLRGERTVLIVTHRPATLHACDRAYRLEGGRVRRIEPPAASGAAPT